MDDKDTSFFSLWPNTANRNETFQDLLGIVLYIWVGNGLLAFRAKQRHGLGGPARKHLSDNDILSISRCAPTKAFRCHALPVFEIVMIILWHQKLGLYAREKPINVSVGPLYRFRNVLNDCHAVNHAIDPCFRSADHPTVSSDAPVQFYPLML